MRLPTSGTEHAPFSMALVVLPQGFCHGSTAGHSKRVKRITDTWANSSGPSFNDLPTLRCNSGKACRSSEVTVHAGLEFGAVNGAMVGGHRISTMNNEASMYQILSGKSP